MATNFLHTVDKIAEISKGLVQLGSGKFINDFLSSLFFFSVPPPFQGVVHVS